MSREWRRYLFADGALIGVAAIWGLTFVTVKNAIILLPPFSFNFYRFSLAAFVMLLFAVPQWKSIDKSTVKAGLLLGFFLFAGYSFQTVGLLYTSASNAGFITGLSVVLVPLFGIFLSRQIPGTGVIFGAICATVGLAFLSLGDVNRFNTGDILILFCAVSFALHIIFVGKYSRHHSTVWLVTWQIATVAVLSGISALFFEPGVNQFVPAVWPALIITALLATCLAFFMQNYMQRFTSPSHTAIIFTTEPVFAAVFAVLLLQETLHIRAYWGGALILAGMLLSEFRSIPGLNVTAISLPGQGED
ncbi:MAG: DMT family transporter [Clostridiales bacterium]|nr:DMT family transporter [Clostridiales bacterium]